jgi:hypothetical protein
LIKVHQTSEQVIDVITRDRVLFAGASQQTTQNADQVTKSFRDYVEKHKAEISALQLLYSRPYRHRLTEPMLKELEKKLREEHAAWTEDRLWDASATLSLRVIGFQTSRQLRYYALGDLEWLRRSKRVHADCGFGGLRYPGPREPVDRIVKNGPMLKAAAIRYTAQEKQYETDTGTRN